jgi:acetyl esterase/lipase
MSADELSLEAAVARRMPPSLRVLAVVAGVLGALVVSLFSWSLVSPKPAVLLIRTMFDRNWRRVSREMAKHVPEGISEVLHEQYLDSSDSAYLDVYYPDRADTARGLPTIVWLHGGAWVSGSKEDVANYLRILASYGFTAVGVGYSLAQAQKYPEPVRQAAAALTYLQQHAERLRVDAERLVLAGDSAGAQIAAQLALLITDGDYATRLGIPAPIRLAELRAVLLHCGGYDLSIKSAKGGMGNGFLRTVMWAYTGSRNYLAMPQVDLASITGRVGADFPPAFVTAGNADPLLPHSLALVEALSDQGADVETLFFPVGYEPALGHEYQFKLDSRAAQLVLARSVDFLRRKTV